jgi:coenzyme F420-dependent glucose-6-phosphate dehydrogenase
VLGAIGAQTSSLRVGTGVTCPTMRIHPAVVAQAAATVACLMPGRFFLGVGSGEALNEHIVGGAWPSPAVRQRMLAEGVEVIRLLLEGGERTHHGEHFSVADAQVYNLPSDPVPIYIAAAGRHAAELAGQSGDGMVCSDPSAETVQAFDGSGGTGKPRYGQLTVCWARTEKAAVRTAHEIWPNGAMSGRFKAELPRPSHFEEVARTVRPEDVAAEVICGPEPERHLAGIRRYIDAGFDHVYIHQVGPDQAGFMRFYEREILPRFKAGLPR